MRVFLLMLILLLATEATAQVLNGKTIWSGTVEVTEKIRVERDAVLIVKPETKVTFLGGSLEVAGQLQADRAEFSGKKWQGIVLKGCDDSTVLRKVLISGAKIGVQVVGGNPLLENNRFTENRVGVELRQKSAAIVRNNRFDQNEKVGLFVKDGATAEVTGNQFERHGHYAAYIYRATPVKFSENIFAHNVTGLMVSFSGTDPVLNRNRFVDNGTGIRIERAAKPIVVGNTISGNTVGIDLYRRADPEIRGNLIEKNSKGVAIAYSSYPLITLNDFQNNGQALYLEFQSSTWEGQQGGVERSSETAKRSAFAGQNKIVSESTPPPYLDGTVHAPDNWWGEAATMELLRIGQQGNPSFITDGRDLPTFVDAGKTYPLDRVEFFPYRDQPFSLEGGAQ